MFDVRLRRFSDAGVRGAVLPSLTLDVTQVDSASPKLTFSVSEKIAGKLESPFLVGVEYSTGGAWVQPRNGLFIVTGESGDEVDPSGAVTFDAEGVVGWLFRYYPLWWRLGDAVLERQFTDQTVGFVMLDLVLRAQADSAWAPNLTVGFSTGFDSSGVAWTERVTQNWPLFTSTLSTVVQSLAEQGYMEWWADGFHLRIVNPGFGNDHSNDVTLGGPGFSRAPGKAEFNPATQLVVKYDQGWTHFDNPGAVARFGNVYRVMSQSNTPTREAAEFNAQPALTEARNLIRERSYEWNPSVSGPSPWEDFQMGDTVTARTRNGKSIQRVIGIVVSKRDSAVTARVVVGSKILSLQAKMANRAASASVGQIIGGSGAAVPPVQMPGAAPVAPTAVRVASNSGTWADDGSARSNVVIAWDEVTQAVDGTGIDPAAYEVWTRIASRTAQLLTSTSDLSVNVDTWTPGVVQLVKVRAVSRAGVAGAFSNEISVTPASPVSVVPKPPTGLAVSSNVATFSSDGRSVATVTVTWAAVTQSTDNLAVAIGGYRAEVEDGQEWVPLAEVLTPRQATITVPSGVTRRVRVRARSVLDVWGDPSTPLSVTGALPTAITAAPSAPILTTGGGGVFIRWNGLLTTGAPPSGFQAVYAETRIGTSGSFTRAAGPLAAGAGQVAQVRPAVGSTVQARLVLIDTLGRVGATSAVSQIVTTGYDGQDIIAGSISVDKVSPAFGQDLDLTSNGAVNIIISGQAEMQNSIANATDTANGAQSAAAGAVDAAVAASAGVTNVQGQVNNLSAQQTATQAQLGQVSMYYRFGVDGAIIGRSDSATQLLLRNTGASIRVNGVDVSTWDAGQMFVPSLVTETVVLSAHRIEKVGGRTVFRAITT